MRLWHGFGKFNFLVHHLRIYPVLLNQLQSLRVLAESACSSPSKPWLRIETRYRVLTEGDLGLRSIIYLFLFA